MKRTALMIAAAAMTLTGTVASAQPYGGRNDGGRYEQRYDNNRGGGQRWERGQRLDQRYRGRDRVVSDYNRYRLRAPPRGYNYYRTDSGDIVLALIATGIISAVIAGNANNGYGQPSYGQPSYGYGQPSYGYGQPSYGQGQIYRDAQGRPYTVDRYGRTVWVR